MTNSRLPLASSRDILNYVRASSSSLFPSSPSVVFVGKAGQSGGSRRASQPAAPSQSRQRRWFAAAAGTSACRTRRTPARGACRPPCIGAAAAGPPASGIRTGEGSTVKKFNKMFYNSFFLCLTRRIRPF